MGDLATRLRGISGIADVYIRRVSGMDLPEKYSSLDRSGSGPESLLGRLPHWGAIITKFASHISSDRSDLLHSAMGCTCGRPTAVRRPPDLSVEDASLQTYVSALQNFAQRSRCSADQAEELSDLNAHGLPRGRCSDIEPFHAADQVASSLMMHFHPGLGFGAATQAAIAAGSTNSLTSGASGGMRASQVPPFDSCRRTVNRWLDQSGVPRPGGVIFRHRGYVDEEIGEEEANLARFVCARAYAAHLRPALQIGSKSSGGLIFGPWPSLLGVSAKLRSGACQETAAAVQALDAACVVADQERQKDLTIKQYSGACAIKQAAEGGLWGEVSFLLAAHSTSRTDVFESTRLYRGFLIGVATAGARKVDGVHSGKVRALRAYLVTLARVQFGAGNALYDVSFLEYVNSSTDAALLFFGSLYEEAVAEILEHSHVQRDLPYPSPPLAAYRLRGSSDSDTLMRATADPFKIIAGLTGLKLGGQRGKQCTELPYQNSAVISATCDDRAFAAAAQAPPVGLNLLQSNNSSLRARLTIATEEVASLKSCGNVLRKALSTLQHRATGLEHFLEKAFSLTLTDDSCLEGLLEEYSAATEEYNILVNSFNDANGADVRIT